MDLKLTQEYFSSLSKKPFFIFLGDSSFKKTVSNLLSLGFKEVKISSFCEAIDKRPNIDNLLSYIEEADISASNKIFITGLGEYLAISGMTEMSKILKRIKDINVGGAKIAFLLRGVIPIINELQKDPRFDNRCHEIIPPLDVDLSFNVISQSENNIKPLLAQLEKGATGNFEICSTVNVQNSIFQTKYINNSYEYIKLKVKDFPLSYVIGEDIFWDELQKRLFKLNYSLDKVFEQFMDEKIINISILTRNNFDSWLYFIYLKLNHKTEDYVKYILDITMNSNDFVNNIIIMPIEYDNKNYDKFYKERKDLLKQLSGAFIANFVLENRKKTKNSIFYLTDNTIVEKEEIIAFISQYKKLLNLDTIYPVLNAYLKKYIFISSGELNELFTEYFDCYKNQKVINSLYKNFLQEVDTLALQRKFNLLPTRNSIIESIEKNNTSLWWIDALGVEYLSLVEYLAQKLGVSIKVNITRANLPTITSKNRDFYDNWSGQKEKYTLLDEIKHKESGGFNFINNNMPIHLAKELDFIVDFMEKIATTLSLKKVKKIIIASDHGASRLAVLCNKEEKYPTDTKGEHSGRCCKAFNDYNLPFAAEEDGYLILADYGRFQGSRKANVEVHGGASLEEVIVPIIEVSLKNDNIHVELIDKVVFIDYKKGANINLFIDDNVKNVSVVLNEKRYPAEIKSDNIFSVALPNLKRAGKYHATVYAGNDLIGQIELNAQGAIKTNSDFDDLF